MIDTSTKSALVEKEVVIQRDYICDICKKPFLSWGYSDAGILETLNGTPYSGKKDIKWFIVTTHHFDWGNDSVNSFEHKHVCSTECLRKEFEVYLANDVRECRTACFEVEEHTD